MKYQKIKQKAEENKQTNIASCIFINIVYKPKLKNG